MTENLLDALTGGKDPDEPERMVGLVTRSACRNGVELRILAESYQEEALQVDCPFYDEDDNLESKPSPPETLRAVAARAAISNYFQVRIAIARAMPSGHDSEADYAAALKREGLLP